MGNFILSFFMSDFVTIVFLVIIGLSITGWAFSQGEYAGYGLGWLIGILMTLFLGAIIPETDATNDLEETTSALLFFSILMGIVLGLVVGVGIPLLIRVLDINAKTKVRALTIAAMMSMVVSFGYLMFAAIGIIRLMMMVFIITICASILLKRILSRRQIHTDTQEVDSTRRDIS